MDEGGSRILPENMRIHLTEVAQKIVNAELSNVDRQSICLDQPSGISMNVYLLKRVLSSIPQITALGEDKISVSILKSLGENGHYYIVELFNDILEEVEYFQTDWTNGRLT